MKSRIQFALFAALAIVLLVEAALGQNAPRSGSASNVGGSSGGERQNSASTFVGAANSGQSRWDAGKANFGTAQSSSGTRGDVASPGTQATQKLDNLVPAQGSSQTPKQQIAATTPMSKTPLSRLPMPAEQADSKTARSAKGTKPARVQAGKRSTSLPHSVRGTLHGTDSHTRGTGETSFGSSASALARRNSADPKSVGSSGQFGRTKP